MRKLMLRIGDNADYDEFDDIEEAADYLAAVGVTEVLHWLHLGFEAPGFGGLNYISCYWESLDIVGLTEDEQAALEASLAR